MFSTRYIPSWAAILELTYWDSTWSATRTEW